LDAFQVGPFIIKYTWIFAVFSLMITYILLKKKLKEDRDFQAKFLDSLVNSLLIGVLTFKVSFLLYRPELLTSNPMAALYLTGGKKEWVTAILVSSLYIAWKYKREQWSTRLTSLGIVYGIVTFITAFWLVRTLFFLVF